MTAINRNLDGVVIGERDDWQLSQKHPAHGWASIKLVHMTARKGSIRKRSFHLGWNGIRFANGRDFTILRNHYPDLYDWVRDCVMENDHGL